MLHRRKKEHGKKLRRRSCEKTKIDGEKWLLNDPYKGEIEEELSATIINLSSFPNKSFIRCYLCTATVQAKTISETKSWDGTPLLYHDPHKH
jgi:hypothetical protein